MKAGTKALTNYVIENKYLSTLSSHRFVHFSENILDPKVKILSLRDEHSVVFDFAKFHYKLSIHHHKENLSNLW